ncbi:MAG: hypothetical protein ABSG81_16020 [Acidimicrobiales bacterium]
MVTGVTPSAGLEVADAVTVESDADAAGASNLTDALLEMGMESVVSSAEKVTFSDVPSATVNCTWPPASVVPPPLGVITALVEEAASVTVFPLTTLWPSGAIRVTVTVPVGRRPPLAADDTTSGLAVTVDAVGDTDRLPKVTTAGGLPTMVTLSAVSVAVKVTASAVASVAVKVAWPDALVVPVTVVITACPVPC